METSSGSENAMPVVTAGTHDLAGWDIGAVVAVDWSPWGSRGDARAKVLANGDGYFLALVEVQPGYRGDAHEHAFTEMLYVLAGSLRTQGVEMGPGDAYVAAAGSVHTDFATDGGATYVSVFKL
jgi:quercetin dioxygenase-like cupin family protein